MGNLGSIYLQAESIRLIVTPLPRAERSFKPACLKECSRSIYAPSKAVTRNHQRRMSALGQSLVPQHCIPTSQICLELSTADNEILAPSCRMPRIAQEPAGRQRFTPFEPDLDHSSLGASAPS